MGLLDAGPRIYPWSRYDSRIDRAPPLVFPNTDPPGQLIALRLLIGLFEAGFYPTAIFYLSTFYTRFDLGLRIGLFYGQYAVAGAFSSAIGASSSSFFRKITIDPRDADVRTIQHTESSI
jgi:hypothetical protein